MLLLNFVILAHFFSTISKLTETDRAALPIDKGQIDAGYRRARHLLTHHLSILVKERVASIHTFRFRNLNYY